MEFGANAMMPGSPYLMKIWWWNRIGRFGIADTLSRWLYVSEVDGLPLNPVGRDVFKNFVHLMVWGSVEAACKVLEVLAPSLVLGLEIAGFLNTIYKVFKFGRYMLFRRDKSYISVGYLISTFKKT